MVAFYADLLRLPIVERSAGVALLDAGGCQLLLHAIPAAIAETIEIADPPEPREDTPIKLAFFTPDLAATRDYLVSRGARFDPVRTFGALSVCDGTDPEGNVLQLSSRPPPGG